MTYGFFVQQNKKSPYISCIGWIYLERVARFELVTHGLGSRYSTTELRPHHIVLLETSVQASLFYPRIAKKSRLQKSLGQILKKETGGLLSKKEIISKGEDLHE